MIRWHQSRDISAISADGTLLLPQVRDGHSVVLLFVHRQVYDIYVAAVFLLSIVVFCC